MTNLQLEDGEINALYAIFDRALRNAGMDALDAVAHFRAKIEQARPRVAPPATPAAPPFVPDREGLAKALEENRSKHNGG